MLLHVIHLYDLTSKNVSPVKHPQKLSACEQVIKERKELVIKERQRARIGFTFLNKLGKARRTKKER